MADQYARQILHHSEPPPPVQSRFFYTSPLPLDDPLSPVPPPISTAQSAQKLPPTPFSEYDHAALDEAWHELRRKILKYNEELGEKGGSQQASRRESVVRDGKRASAYGSRPSSKAGTPRARPIRFSLSQVDRPPELDGSPKTLGLPTASPDGPSSLSDTSGRPFARAPPRKENELPAEERADDGPRRPKPRHADTYEWEDRAHLAEHSPVPSEGQKAKQEIPKTSVAVGVSRLHKVEMPDLRLSPIYWEPVNDIAQVVRGTWFYEDMMLPVETPVANMLEAGYTELQVWTDTWQDELNSAVEIGALGEMKVAHKLWPDRPKQTPTRRPRSSTTDSLLQQAVASDMIEAEPKTSEQVRAEQVEVACDVIDITSGPSGPDNKASGTTSWGAQGTLRMYAFCGVMYANARQARILKPSLMPSSYYGRRPLANYIRKNRKLGIAVVRGFDQAAWDRLHPQKVSKLLLQAEVGVSTSASGSAPRARQQLDPELAKSKRPKVTDLVLVIHGIGQKLSQRMESWHFTHAVNALRRDVNVEMGTKEVRTRLRSDIGGIMALPVNWRTSFEEVGFDTDLSRNDVPAFSLADITPETLASIRSTINDCVLDIPYYLSDHQPKMIAAVVKEANRVYRLWCLNNPGFNKWGRVHLVAHSLGSVMAMDILSRQPTRIPQHLLDPRIVNLEAENLDHFLFDTADLFLCGSPAGFFLLLKHAQLLPRIDHPSTVAKGDTGANMSTICGERGQYGCLAVENVYNIINGYDPVAYRMNAAVDSAYAASIKQAFIPSATSNWLGTMLFGNTPGTSAAQQPLVSGLPSAVEMETHNFTREEIAEKRMYLLNDNGQIDYFVKYGGGPFEIQYLTMLGAHSSYWLLKDFVRMIVIEVGREKGRDGTLAGMRAVKKKKAAA